MGREMGGSFKREGIYVNRQLIHVKVWQKRAKFCKAKPRNQQAISMELSSDKSCCSTGNNQARDQAGIVQLSWKLSSRWADSNHAAQQALINFHWLSNFTYGNIYVLMLLSQFVLPSLSPTVSTSLCSVSCIAETNATLQTNYTSIKNLKIQWYLI